MIRRSPTQKRNHNLLFGVYFVVCFYWNCTQETNHNLPLLVSPWMPRCVPQHTKRVRRSCFHALAVAQAQEEGDDDAEEEEQ